MTDKEAELLPCPFCGHTDIVFAPPNHAVPKGWLIECDDLSDGCGAALIGCTKAELITAWNTRAPASERDMTVAWLCAFTDEGEAKLERAAEALADFARDRFASTIETNWSTMGDSRQQYFRDAVATVLAALKAQERESFQARVQPWMTACFGPKISADKLERNDRFMEEALELVQASGYPKERANALIEYVYGRDQGEINQEVGGVMVTLAAHCLAHGVDMHEAAETELARIWTKVEQIRAKQAAKPTGSALPTAPEHGALKAQEGLATEDFPGQLQRLYDTLSGEMLEERGGSLWCRLCLQDAGEDGLHHAPECPLYQPHMDETISAPGTEAGKP